MTLEDIQKMILKNTYTKSDILRRIRLTREYEEYFFFMMRGEGGSLTEFFTMKKVSMDDRKCMGEWEESFFTTMSKDTMYKTFHALEEWLNDTEVFNLYVSFDPNPEEIMQFATFLRESISPTLVLDVHTDKTLLGGCSFAYKGIFHDFTLRYWMLKSRDDILQIIDKHAKQMGLIRENRKIG